MKEKDNDFKMYINGKLVNNTDREEEECSILYTILGAITTIFLLFSLLILS